MNQDACRSYPQSEAWDKAIEDSKYMFRLEEGWDDGIGKVIKLQTWERAKEFAQGLLKQIESSTQGYVDAPMISACADGSVDLYWSCYGFSLLINVPEELDEQISYYGDNRGILHSKLCIHSTDTTISDIAPWIAKVIEPTSPCD